MEPQEKQLILFALGIVHSAWSTFARRLARHAEKSESMHALYTQVESGLAELERTIRKS
jgi:hypothetical protein